MIYVWKCGQCNFTVIPAGKDRGIVFTSSSTAYSEVFLFETFVSLSRNGCSLRSSAYLRQAYRELCEEHVYPDAAEVLSSLTTLRKAIVLYLSLVIAGLPEAVTQCLRCMRSDGSYAVICFDGLQLGYRLKFMGPFSRPSVSVSPIARASVYAHVVIDGALAKAIGGAMSNTASSSQNKITTLTAMRGNVMAFIVLNGYVRVDGVAATFSGSALSEGGKKERGWDPVEDGGVRVALIEFLRLFFMCRRAARAPAMDIIGGPVDLLRRVPRILMNAVHATAADISDDAKEVSEGGAGGLIEGDAASRSQKGQADEPATDEAKDGDIDGWASDVEGFDGGDAETAEEHLDDDYEAALPYEPPARPWDDASPLISHAQRFFEPALADTGGATGAARLRQLLPLHAGTPGTVSSALKVVDFVRAVTVDPFTAWAPRDNWSGVGAVFDSLLDEEFNVENLLGVVDRADVTELRLLSGAVAYLSPALCADPVKRHTLAELLLALIETRGDYDDFVDDAQASDGPTSMQTHSTGSVDDSESDDEDYTKEAMVLAHHEHAFTPRQFEATWLVPPATPASYAAAHGIPVGEREDFLKTGVWAPGLPMLRSLPGFVGASSAQTDAPDCQHDMGKQQSHTGGTFGGFCTCSHPKCLGVVVLDESESQRMPIEFVIQRFATLPDVIVYDFACATLKTSLVRLPLVAKKVSLRVDRFHWRKNYTLCSKAMSPDSYVSMDGTNTSSSEERNAMSKRQQHHLRQMKQSAFITFTVYQQALSNAIAIYRDEVTKHTTIKWPEWYRRTHVDNERS